jgi:cytoskeletal protein CcmA (bactofilin family)
MPTVVSVVVVTSLLGGLSTKLAVHALDESGFARNRVSAVHAAEAGINEAIRQLSSTSGATWCGVAPSDATRLPGGGNAPGGQQYSVVVRDTTGTWGTCSVTDPIRLIQATGYSPSAAAPGRATRLMEAQVRLVPEYALPGGGFRFNHALFSNSPSSQIALANNVTVYGDGSGENGHTYTNAHATFVNAVEVHGDVTVQGNVTLANSTRVYGSVHASGSVTMQLGSQVDGNVTAATGSISLANQARVVGYARAGTTISKTGSASILGGEFPNSPTAPQPTQYLPTFNWNPADPLWPQPILYHADCDAFATYLLLHAAAFSGTHKISTDCVVEFQQQTTVLLAGPTALIADGSFELKHSARFLAAPGVNEPPLWLIALHQGTSGSDSQGISIQNSATISVPVFFYTRNQFNKSNSTSITGQIYAEKVNVSSSYVHTMRLMSPVGFSPASGSGGSGFNVQLLYLREVR